MSDSVAKFNELNLDAPNGAAPAPEGDAASKFASLDLDTPAVAPSTKSKVRTLADLSKMTYAQKVMHVEDQSGDPNAKNPSSSATGVGQFIKPTWLATVRKHRPDLAQGKSDAEILAMRSDPALSEQMIEAHAADNAEKLKANGVPVSDASKYGAHWFGADKFAQIAKADPKTRMEDLIGKDAAVNNGLAGKTADDVKTLLAQRMGGDYMPQDQSWDDTLSQARENLLPSVGHMAAGVYQTVRHPIDTMNTLKQLGIGLDSKIRGYAGENQEPEQKAQDEALVDALGHSYKEKYGTLDGFKQYLAHDPAGVLFDASTVLTAGGGAAAKIPGIVGKAGELAGTVGKVINPLNPGGLISGGVKALTTPAAIVDKAGNIAPKVDALIKKVTGDTMSAADLVDPTIKADFVATVAKKGATEASVREGLLRSLGLKAPTAVVEKGAPSEAVKEVTQNSIESNNARLAKHSSTLAGAPNNSSLAEALDKAHTRSLNGANAQYDIIRNMPGSFGKQIPMSDMGTQIRKNFTTSGIAAADLPTLRASGHTQAANAIDFLWKNWGQGKTILQKGGEVNAPEILAMRKALNNFRSAATGSDVKAVSDVIDGFDTSIADLSKRGFFKSPTGQPLPNIGTQIKKANAAYKTHFDNFETANGSNNAMVNAVKKLKSGQTRDALGNLAPSGDEALYTQAQAGLAKDLMHPTKGPATYNNLSKAIGSSAPIDEHLKGLLANPETNGATEMLNSPVAQKAFKGSPDALSMARHIHSAHMINNAKPALDARGASVLKSVLGSLGAKGVSSVAGYEALGMTGLVVGPMVEAALEKASKAYQTRAAMAGAKSTQGLIRRGIGSTARRVTNPAALAAEHYENQAQDIQRARGGKVDIDSLVDRLVSRWKHAKKVTDRTTEPLLRADDNSIAKALDIAQRNI